MKGPGPLRLRFRPTSDRLRETLFDVLGPSVEDSLFVDLFAGTGAVGIEAISRGARETIFVESSAKAARLIRENLKSLDILSGAELIEAPALRGLERMASPPTARRFHLPRPTVRKNPPTTSEVLEFLDASHLIAPHGIVIVEHYWRTAIAPAARIAWNVPASSNKVMPTFLLPAGSRRLA